MKGTVSNLMNVIDAYVAKDDRRPLWGWHDDHRAHDRSPEYRPALQQVRAEFEQLLRVCETQGALGGRALQLGLGRGGAAHIALRVAFDFVCSIDCDLTAVRDLANNWKLDPEHDLVCMGPTGSSLVRAQAMRVDQFYDLLLIDADHSEAGVRRDYEDYAPLVRPGGVIAFHDALKRPTYEEEITVWKFLADLPVMMIGSEVGIAVLVKPQGAST